MPEPRAVGRVALLSLERWDDIWRRNQHLAAELTSAGWCQELVFVNPPSKELTPNQTPVDGVVVVQPPLQRPVRWGGLQASAAWLRRELPELELLWINHAPLGRWLLGVTAAVYDVTDDWRLAQNGPLTKCRIIRAEDRLARSARTIVCSAELRRRWHDRYGVSATVVQNGVDTDAVRAAAPIELPGAGPHLGYIGTVQSERIDVKLLVALAKNVTGTIHLVGPDHLDPGSRGRLETIDNIRLHGAVPAAEVPAWLVAMDVLLLPHVISPFTLSLDAIKAHEYLATDRPIVATPTSGFQRLAEPGLAVVPAEAFVSAVKDALSDPPSTHGRHVVSWRERAREFAIAAWGVQ